MITYLFGAGASKGAVPIVNDLMLSIIDVRDQLKKEFVISGTYIDVGGEPYGAQAVFDELIKDFDWIIDACRNHQSIDTFAKKLFIQGEFGQIKKLKTVVSIYFLIIQTQSKADIRYDSFFASLLQGNHLEMPSNLRILTWNYDYQFEKAYAEYSRDFRFESCQSLLNIYSKNSRHQNFNTDRFGIIKLNGTASLILDIERSYPLNMVNETNVEFNSKFIELLLKHYTSLHHVGKLKDRLVPTLSFAWEDYSSDMVVKKNAIEFTKKTEVLVVIGYSFPFFNRFLDRDIIRAMTSLKKVYFQAPDADVLKERFLAIRDDLKDEDLLIRKDLKQFVFPNEF